MKNKTNDSGADFILFSATRPIQIDDTLLEELEERHPNIALGYDNLDQRVADFSEKQGIAYVSSLSEMRELQAGGNPPHLPCDGHWSRDAHQRAAELLASYLVTREYI
jgi:hypothetical protein